MKCLIVMTCDNSDAVPVTEALQFAIEMQNVGRVTRVLFMLQGSAFSQEGYADLLQKPGHPSVSQLLQDALTAGVRFFAYQPDFNERQLNYNTLIDGCQVLDAAAVSQFIGEGCPVFTYCSAGGPV